MLNEYLYNLEWSLSHHYYDQKTIIDKDGFEVVSVDSTPILLGYEDKLGINHWCESDKATKNLTNDEYEVVQRMVTKSPDMYRFICSLEKWWPVDSDQYRELNAIRQFIENGEEEK